MVLVVLLHYNSATGLYHWCSEYKMSVPQSVSFSLPANFDSIGVKFIA